MSFQNDYAALAIQATARRLNWTAEDLKHCGSVIYGRPSHRIAMQQKIALKMALAECDRVYAELSSRPRRKHKRNMPLINLRAGKKHDQ